MMRKLLPWIGAVLSVSLGGTMFAIGLTSKMDAGGSLSQAERLHQAQLDVAEAEAALGNSDLSDAVESARRANATAVEVGRVTEQMSELLVDTRSRVEAMLAASQRGAGSAVFARRQTEIASHILATIATYQGAAQRYSGITNRALERVLRALRETNESFPGR